MENINVKINEQTRIVNLLISSMKKESLLRVDYHQDPYFKMNFNLDILQNMDWQK